MRTTGVVLAALVMAAPALAQNGAAHGTPQVAPNGDVTVNVQGDQSRWIDNDYMRSFYALSVERLGKAAPKLDFEDYRDRSYAIFRAFGVSMGMSPEGMVDHLKDIPRQMVGIVKDDPKVLGSYESFVVALMGPQ